jgi:hypothetical protein
MNKKVPLWVLLLISWFFCMIIILFGAEVLVVRTSKSHSFFSRTIIAIASFPHLVKETFATLDQPSLLVVRNLYPGKTKFEVKKNYIDSNYILLSTFDPQRNRAVVKLLRLYDQKIIYQWKPDFDNLEDMIVGKSLYWQHPTKNNMRIIHPLLLTDGSIVFNMEMSPLIKINKDSKIVWTSNGSFHHSLEQDAQGNIWAPSLIEHSKFLRHVLPGLKDHAITEISPDGKMLLQKSVAEILDENGYRGLLLGGAYETDLLHLNDVQPALTTTKYWNKNDLLISVKNKSTVFLYRPSTNKIIWLKTGPWLNQHDPDFIDSTRIGIFGNDVVRSSSEGFTDAVSMETSTNGNNHEYIYDFKTNTVDTPYNEFFKKAKITTQTEGQSDILSNGDLFVEETNNNRLLRGNKTEIIWQYVDRIDSKWNAALSWSRFITKDEFKKLKFLNTN